MRRDALSRPDRFRHLMQLPGPSTASIASLLTDWQAADFSALDAGWQQLAHPASTTDEPSIIRRAYLERPRGHSKTSDMALQLVYVLTAAKQALRGVAAAADREQAALIHQAMAKLIEANRGLCSTLAVTQKAITNRKTGSRLELISSDVASSWGLLPDFVICDELCHWTQPDLWYSLLSSAAKRPDCVLVVMTNAGVGQGWQWEVREAARQDPQWYFSSLKGCHAPWISADSLAEQQRLLPATVYARLWQNEWQHSAGDFLPMAAIEACRDSSLAPKERGERGVQYIAAIDYAEKHDLTVGVVVHWNGNLIEVDRMDVVCPSPEQHTPVSWVENWLDRMARSFPGIRFMIDEYQLVGVIQRLEHRLPIERFAFGAGKGNHELAMLLRQMILERRVAWYPDCGALTDSQLAGRDDLETELAALILRQSAAGRIRIDHLSDGIHHDDRSFALGAALLAAMKLEPSGDWMIVEDWA